MLHPATARIEATATVIAVIGVFIGYLQRWGGKRFARFCAAAYALSMNGDARQACRIDAYLAPARIHLTRILMSVSLTVEFGGIGTLPQTPTPPFLTLSISFVSAALSPA